MLYGRLTAVRNWMARDLANLDPSPYMTAYLKAALSRLDDARTVLAGAGWGTGPTPPVEQQEASLEAVWGDLAECLGAIWLLCQRGQIPTEVRDHVSEAGQILAWIWDTRTRPGCRGDAIEQEGRA